MELIFLPAWPASSERASTAETLPARRRPEFRARSPIGPQFVVFLALGGITEHLVSFVNLFKLFLRLLLIFGDVGMVLASQLAEGFLDFRIAGGAWHTQGLVIIFVTDSHFCSCS